MKESKLKKMLKLKRKYKDCDKCNFAYIRNRVVFGLGGFNKHVLIIGEAPGPDEDKKGKPFIGRAGKILDKMLKRMHLERNDTFITNSCLCYPGRNDNGNFNHPEEEEMIRCAPRLKKMVSILRPKLIIALGNCALFALTSKTGIAANRGIRPYVDFDFETFIIVTYHPSAVMRNEDYKNKAKKDCKKIGEFLDGKPKRKQQKRKKLKKAWPKKLY